MAIQIVSIGIVLIIVFFALKRQHKKDKRYFGGPFEYTRKEKNILEKYLQEYEPVKPDSRLATIKKNKWELDDIAKRATEIIFDSPIPGKVLRTDLRAGDLVKLIFISDQEDEMAERMWVKVMGEKDGLYFGELDNEPFGTTALIHSQVIWFHANHVFDIDKKKD
jgi:hypothetical protein